MKKIIFSIVAIATLTINSLFLFGGTGDSIFDLSNLAKISTAQAEDSNNREWARTGVTGHTSDGTITYEVECRSGNIVQCTLYEKRSSWDL